MNVNIEESRQCNEYNIAMLAEYLDVDPKLLQGYYAELFQNKFFIDAVNDNVRSVRSNWGFKKGIFGMEVIPSVDWFAFERILIYVLIRHFKPSKILETGVYYGGNTVFALLALHVNGVGELVSIDFPDSEIRANPDSTERHPMVGDSELYDRQLKPGFIVPEYLRDTWTLIEGDSLQEIPKLSSGFEFYLHDSDHSMPFLTKEMNSAWEKLTGSGVMLVDDIDWSNAFYAFCSSNRLYPLLLTDNGKDNLRVRTGLVVKGHKKNGNPMFT